MTEHLARIALSFSFLLGGCALCLPGYGQSDDVLHEIANLHDPAWGIREAAARNLGQMGDRRAVPALIAALNDTDPMLRSAAVSALAKLKDPRSIEPLIAVAGKNADTQAAGSAILALGGFKDARAVAALMNVLNRSTRGQDETVASSLGRIGATAVPPLLAELKSGGPDARARMLDALGWIDDPRATDTLIGFLNDPDPRVREVVVTGLKGHWDAAVALLSPFDSANWMKLFRQRVAPPPPPKDPRVPSLLMGALQDPDAGVQSAAARALGALKVAAAVDPLIALLRESANGAKTAPGRNPKTALRKSISTVLGGFGDARAVDTLIATLGDPDDEVRMWSARSLGQINDRRATKPLVALVNDKNNSVRRAALNALAELKDPSAAEPLIEALRRESAEIPAKIAAARSRAMTPQEKGSAARMMVMTDPVLEDGPYALSQIGGPATALLIGAMKSKDSVFRQRILASLTGSKDASAVDTMVDALSDEDEEVRSAALKALASVTDAKAATPFMNAWKKADSAARYDAIYFLCRNEAAWTTGPVIETMREKDSVFSARCLGPSEPVRASIADAVIPLLSDEDNYTRRIAARTLVALIPNPLLFGASAVPAETRGERALQQSLKQRNAVVICAAASYFVARGEEGSEYELIDALNAAGDESLAQYFLICGNAKMEDAGRAWLKEHHREIDSRMFGPMWGQLLARPTT